MRTQLTWTPHMVSYLKHYIKVGLSAQEIAIAMTGMFRVNFTRNMIIGKCFREFKGMGKVKTK